MSIEPDQFQKIISNTKKFVQSAKRGLKKGEYRQAVEWYLKAVRQRNKAKERIDKLHSVELPRDIYLYDKELNERKKRGQWLQRSSLWLDEALRLAKKYKLKAKEIEIYELREDWDKAVILCRKVADTERAKKILKELVQKGNYYTVASIYKRIKDYKRAVEYYQKCGHYKKAIKIAESQSFAKSQVDQIYLKFIDSYLEDGDQKLKQSNLTYGDEGAFFDNIAQASYQKAAQLAERRGFISKAIQIYEEKTRVSRAKINSLKKKLEEEGTA